MIGSGVTWARSASCSASRATGRWTRRIEKFAVQFGDTLLGPVGGLGAAEIQRMTRGTRNRGGRGRTRIGVGQGRDGAIEVGDGGKRAAGGWLHGVAPELVLAQAACSRRTMPPVQCGRARPSRRRPPHRQDARALRAGSGDRADAGSQRSGLPLPYSAAAG